jgi:hypothetical protein
MFGVQSAELGSSKNQRRAVEASLGAVGIASTKAATEARVNTGREVQGAGPAYPAVEKREGGFTRALSQGGRRVGPSAVGYG